jgi:TRAP transporter 4TM/12TM fusion protein
MMSTVNEAADYSVDDQELSQATQDDELARLRGPRRAIVVVFAFAWVGWQTWIAATVPLAPTQMRSLHLAFALSLLFVMLSITPKSWPEPVRLVVDLVAAAVAAVSMLHLFVNFADPSFQRVIAPEPVDVALGWTAIAIVTVAVWRAAGPPLAITALLAVAYGAFGQHLSGTVGHGGFSPERLLASYYLRVEGMLGTAVGASAVTIFPVVLFGALLISLGGGRFFSDLAVSLAGRVSGATGKITVVTSGLFGMIAGSGAANVASTGVFTIPMMVRQGFSRTWSAAVESAAAIGGQITPPIMGAAAFVMAEFLNVPYSDIVKHAVIPALLFYFMVLLTVHCLAKQQGIGRLEGDLPRPQAVLLEGWQFVLPLLWLLFTLATERQSVAGGAVQSTGLLIVLELGRRIVARRSLELGRIVDGVIRGAKTGLVVAAACAAVQILIATVGLTGIGIKLSNILVDLAGGSLLALLLLTMLASLILGTGLPTVPSYLILAILTAPALSEFGISLIAAHFFVLYFGVMSDLTPPTALGPTIAAGIAEAPLMRTMFRALQVGLAGFILPFMFIYRPPLMLVGTTWDTVVACGAAATAVIFLAVGLTGYFQRTVTLFERALLVVAAGALIPEHLAVNLVAVAVGSAIIARSARPAKTQADHRRSVAARETVA